MSHSDDNADVEMENEEESSCVFQIQISEEAESDNLCENSCSASGKTVRKLPWVQFSAFF